VNHQAPSIPTGNDLSVANLNSGGNRGLKQAMAVPLPGIRLNFCDRMGRCTAALSRRSSRQPGVTPILVVIGFVIVALPLEIASVPKQSAIEVLASERPDQSLNESMRTGAYRGWHLVNFKYPKVREPSVETKQWIVI
jgi:hypothetical protein